MDELDKSKLRAPALAQFKKSMVGVGVCVSESNSAFFEHIIYLYTFALPTHFQTYRYHAKDRTYRAQ